MVVTAIKKAMEALEHSDIKLAKKLIADDKKINRLQIAIEEHCITLLGTQQPVATELRELTSVLSVVQEFERMADHAAAIAKLSIEIGDLSKEASSSILPNIDKMCDKTVRMVRKSIEAFLTKDEKKARIVWVSDKTIDTFFDLVYSDTFSIMIEKPELIKQSSKLLWIAHYIERIADRTTNICERTLFLVSGNLDTLDLIR